MPTTDRQLLLLKPEASYNSDPTVAGTNAIMAYDIQYKLASGLYRTPAGDPLQRAMYAAQVGNRQPSLSFKTHLRGHTSPLAVAVFPENHHLLQAAGYVDAWAAGPKTHTYSRDAAGAISLWANWNTDGLEQVVGGLLLDATFEIAPGQRMVQAWMGEGQYQPIVENAMLSPTYVAPKPRLCEGIAFGPFGDVIAVGEFGRVQKATLALRNEVYRQMDPNAAEGCAEVHILRQGSGDDSGPQLTLEITRPGSSDSARWWDRFLLRIESAACSATFGPDALSQSFKINFGRLVVDSIEDAVSGSLFTHKVVCSILGTAAGTTEDDLSFVWTQA